MHKKLNNKQLNRIKKGLVSEHGLLCNAFSIQFFSTIRKLTIQKFENRYQTKIALLNVP